MKKKETKIIGDIEQDIARLWITFLFVVIFLVGAMFCMFFYFLNQFRYGC